MQDKFVNLVKKPPQVKKIVKVKKLKKIYTT